MISIGDFFAEAPTPSAASPAEAGVDVSATRKRKDGSRLAAGLRSWVAALVFFGVAGAAYYGPAAAAEFSADQRRAIEGIIKDYLTKNPDVLLEALQAAKDKIDSEARDKATVALGTRKDEVFNDPDTPTAGNPKGDVALVEFFDYRCPYCKQVEPALESLIGEDRQLRVVYKEYPVLGPESTIAAEAALAARKQGKYEPLHRALMALKGQIDEAAVLKTAASVGLDIERLKRDMAAPEIDAQLQKNAKLADALDIRGTPGFVVGDEIVPGAISLSALRQLIDTARHK